MSLIEGSRLSYDESNGSELAYDDDIDGGEDTYDDIEGSGLVDKEFGSERLWVFSFPCNGLAWTRTIPTVGGSEAGVCVIELLELVTGKLAADSWLRMSRDRRNAVSYCWWIAGSNDGKAPLSTSP